MSTVVPFPSPANPSADMAPSWDPLCKSLHRHVLREIGKGKPVSTTAALEWLKRHKSRPNDPYAARVVRRVFSGFARGHGRFRGAAQ